VLFTLVRAEVLVPLAKGTVSVSARTRFHGFFSLIFQFQQMSNAVVIHL
jgi:hypothetical protein